LHHLKLSVESRTLIEFIFSQKLVEMVCKPIFHNRIKVLSSMEVGRDRIIEVAEDLARQALPVLVLIKTPFKDLLSYVREKFEKIKHGEIFSKIVSTDSNKLRNTKSLQL
jgi:hypothetical protein